tara:strand:- start:1280 stop:1672 length:393 start_codon:yes stop_codon:yes gene_type:complete
MAQKSAAVDHIDHLPQTRPERPIDLVHLARQCLGDEHLEYEILRLYDTTVKTYFGRLQLSSSHDELALNLHSIKGASAGVGAFAIANQAKAAEVELQAGRPLSPERIDDLGLAIEEVRGFIARMLDNEPA